MKSIGVALIKGKFQPFSHNCWNLFILCLVVEAHFIPAFSRENKLELLQIIIITAGDIKTEKEKPALDLTENKSERWTLFMPTMTPQNLCVLIYSDDPKKAAQRFSGRPRTTQSLTDKHSAEQIQSDIPGLPCVREHKFGAPAVPSLLDRCATSGFVVLSAAWRGRPVLEIFTGPRGQVRDHTDHKNTAP